MPKAAKQRNTTHGRSDKTEQYIWSDMKRRCYSPDRRGFANYGGRGIKVCAMWLDGDGGRSGFECFLADMGARPSPEHTLDRKDTGGNYEPANCRWATRDEQNYNKRDTFTFEAFGETFTVASAEARFGIERKALYHRLTIAGMPPEVAVTRPLRVTARRK